MSNKEDLEIEISELKKRVEGLEDLVASIGLYLRGYADHVASDRAGSIAPPIIQGSGRFTAGQAKILQNITQTR